MTKFLVFILHVFFLGKLINCDIDCVSDTLGLDYIGSIDFTENGNLCQPWSSQEPQRHSYNTDEIFRDGVVNAKNYCRNPKGDGDRPWCYTTNPNVRWEYCDISKCMGCSKIAGIPFASMKVQAEFMPDGSYAPNSTVEYKCIDGAVYDEFSGPLKLNCEANGKWSSQKLPRCLWRLKLTDKITSNCWYRAPDKNGNFFYHGEVSVTTDGKKCISWTKQSRYKSFDFKSENIENAQNFCRTLDNFNPWCYIDEKLAWGFCKVAQCTGCAFIPYVKYTSFNIASSTINNLENTFATAEIQYKCKFGSLIGSSTIQCKSGEWTTPPKCEIKFCSSNEPMVENAYIIRRNPLYASDEDFGNEELNIDDSEIIYSCYVGFTCSDSSEEEIVFKCKDGIWILQSKSTSCVAV